MDLTTLERYAPLLASLALGSLGVVSLASRRREVVWRLFAAFCLLLMGATGVAFLPTAIGSDEWAFASALNHVWMNLLVNANDALQGNPGQIRVRTHFDDERVRVEIADIGAGIPREDLPRVFDPGFTTMGMGVGTGLGLAICYQIVQQHNGTIRVAPGPESGTQVSVSLARDLPNI